jgi:Holliday junction resolvasome RuvABC endonuclease subunit
MILALDISTTCIGYSIFDEDGNLIELNCVKFNSKLTKFEKLEEFKKVTEYFKKFPIKYIAIEEPLKKFAGKFSSADTIALLNFFNGMVSSYLYLEFGMEPFYFNVNNARSLAFGKKSASSDQAEETEKGGNSKKHEIWHKVMQLEPLIQWRYGPKSRKLLDENYDMADAYVIGLAMLITIDKQKTVAQ